MINNEYRGERLSFFKIFSQKKYKLVIPILQREYAQGRRSDYVSEVRNGFLDALYRYLKEGLPNRDLDFVYGTLQLGKNNEPVLFVPLDGQQRLTTLFLLHWFLSQISNSESAKNLFFETLVVDNRSLFTYETRQSSAEFCDMLMEQRIDMNHLEKDRFNNPSLSLTLMNQPQFFLNWKKDPTIQSMLVMLDAIYEKFQGCEDYLEKLIDEENPVVTFIFMDLKNYRLTDELYIKMNSRGKTLTNFENFKAKYEQYIKRFNSNCPRKFYLSFSGEKKEVSIQQYFSFNIDTKWTSLLWRFCENDKKGMLDSYFEKLIRTFLTTHYASTATTDSSDDRDKIFDLLMSSDKSLSFSKYESAGLLTLESLLSLIDSLDALCDIDSIKDSIISSDYVFYFNNGKVFEKVLKNGQTSPEKIDLYRSDRLRFFAYVQYLILYKNKLKGLNEWMRVIHNLTHPDNSIIDDNESFVRAVKSIEKQLPFAPLIIKQLQNVSFEGFAKHQSREESIKAHLIDKEDWRKLVEDTEKHHYFTGQIGFLLDFAGINNYFSKNQNLYWSDKENRIYKEKFSRYSKIASFIFELDSDSKNRVNDGEKLFERAVLAEGDYLLSKNQEKRNLLSTETVSGNIKRDLSWKRLLRLDDETMSDRQEFVKKTFDKIENTDNINESLKGLCMPETDRQWRNMLIKSPKLIEVCARGYIQFCEDSIRLLNKTKISHNHDELFTYYLWVEKFKENQEIFNGFQTQYKKSRCTDDVPHILIDGFYINHSECQIKIEAFAKNNDLDFYCIFFEYKNRHNFNYPSIVINLLKDLGFKLWEKEQGGDNQYIYKTSNVNTVFRKVRNLADSLSNLKSEGAFKRT